MEVPRLQLTSTISCKEGIQLVFRRLGSMQNEWHWLRKRNPFATDPPSRDGRANPEGRTTSFGFFGTYGGFSRLEEIARRMSDHVGNLLGLGLAVHIDLLDLSRQTFGNSFIGWKPGAPGSRRTLRR
jgi:hypothetical protein